jgi:molecular chaperone GrpE
MSDTTHHDPWATPPGAHESLGEPDGELLDDSAEAAQAVEADVAALLGERDELRSLAQRLQADFENYRKRVVREQTALVERASGSLVEQLLPVLDNFELALASLEGVDEQVRKGVELAYSGLVAVLERAGLERMNTDGAVFDPTEHEAVLHDDSGGGGDPIVTDTMRTGYRLKGQVLRPAMVRVGHK